MSLFRVSLSWIYSYETSAFTRRKIEWHFWNDCSTWREAGGNPPGCIGNDSSKEVWANVQTWRQTCQVFLEKHINTKSGSSIFIHHLPAALLKPAHTSILCFLCESTIWPTLLTLPFMHQEIRKTFHIKLSVRILRHCFFSQLNKQVGYYFKGWSSSPPYWVTNRDTFLDFFFFLRNVFVSQKLKWGANSLSWIPAWAADSGNKRMI